MNVWYKILISVIIILLVFGSGFWTATRIGGSTTSDFDEYRDRERDISIIMGEIRTEKLNFEEYERIQRTNLVTREKLLDERERSLDIRWDNIRGTENILGEYDDIFREGREATERTRSEIERARDIIQQLSN